VILCEFALIIRNQLKIAMASPNLIEHLTSDFCFCSLRRKSFITCTRILWRFVLPTCRTSSTPPCLVVVMFMNSIQLSSFLKQQTAAGEETIGLQKKSAWNPAILRLNMYM
jgi:hypothetical protein